MRVPPPRRPAWWSEGFTRAGTNGHIAELGVALPARPAGEEAAVQKQERAHAMLSKSAGLLVRVPSLWLVMTGRGRS